MYKRQPADFADWDCDGVVSFLHTIHVCEDLEARDDAAQKVCGVWAACATEVLDDDATTAAPAPAPVPANCSATACEVPHAAWLGDGACDADISQCYNTAACGWDGGDCCEATCRDTATRTCGTAAPYVCKDPDAQGCGSRAAAEIELEGGAGAYDYALYSVILDGFAAVSSGSYAGAASTTPACLADGCYVEPESSRDAAKEWPPWLEVGNAAAVARLVLLSVSGLDDATLPSLPGGVKAKCYETRHAPGERRALDAVAVERVHHEDQPVGVVEVMAPQRAQLLLAAHVPHREHHVLVLHLLHVEA